MGQVPGAVASMPDSIWNDKSYVLAEVKKDGYAFEHADPSLKKDKDVVLAAVKQNREVLLRTPVNNIEYFPPNFEGLVLGCIDADFCK